MTPSTSQSEPSIDRRLTHTLRFILPLLCAWLVCFQKNAIGQTIGQACVACHSNDKPLRDQAQIGLRQANLFFGMEGNGQQALEPARGDIHASAVGKIWQGDSLSPGFQRIIDHLRWTKDSPEFKNRCLTCHAGVQAETSDGSTLGRPETDFLADRLLNIKNSIGCEACHGRGKEYYLEHIGPNWLSKSTSEKSKFGFYDLENSAVAARVCISCHLGSPKESKVVTHEMYAAGHPPLPPFDLAKFLDSTCNKHWLDLKEKSASWAEQTQVDQRIRVEYLKNHFLSPRTPSVDSRQSDALQTLDMEIAGHFRKTQKSLIGQVTSNLASHDLMAHYAQEDPTWGDYAIYDCVGCHQTLYKQIRGVYGQPGRVPGRPQASLWTRPVSATMKLVSLDRLDSLQKQIDTELNVTPFGSKIRIHTVLQEYLAERQQADVQLIERATHKLDAREASAWIRGYLSEKRDALGNEWVAKQVYWTLESYMDDLERCNKESGQVDPRVLNLRESFRSLAAIAPPLSRIESCDVKSGLATGHDQAANLAFYSQLQAFVDLFLRSPL